MMADRENLGIGTADGRIMVHDLRNNVTRMVPEYVKLGAARKEWTGRASEAET